jgi:hypothetical protein
MIERVKATCGELPEVATADAGYFTPGNVRYCDEQGLEALIAAGREHDRGEGVEGRTQADESARRMRAKLDSDEGRALYLGSDRAAPLMAAVYSMARRSWKEAAFPGGGGSLRSSQIAGWAGAMAMIACSPWSLTWLNASRTWTGEKPPRPLPVKLYRAPSQATSPGREW